MYNIGKNIKVDGHISWSTAILAYSVLDREGVPITSHERLFLTNCCCSGRIADLICLVHRFRSSGILTEILRAT